MFACCMNDTQQGPWAALFRIAERHATSDDQRRRAMNQGMTEPYEAIRLVTGILFGSIPLDDDEPEVDDADLLAALTLVDHMRADEDRVELELLNAARGRGMTWQSIAQGTGLNSAQAVQQRYNRLNARQGS